MTAQDLDKDAELDRLWRRFTRDLSSAILAFAGMTENKAPERLAKTWERLCEADIDVAALLHHGIEEISVITARYDRPNSPAERHLQMLGEIAGMAAIAREANPGASVDTLGELIGLGEEEIRRQLDEDASEPPPPAA